MRHRWDSESGKRGVEGRNALRLAGALALGKRPRSREWVGVIVLAGPIVGGESLTINLWCEHGQAKLVAEWDRKKTCRMSEAMIARRIKERLVKFRIMAE